MLSGMHLWALIGGGLIGTAASLLLFAHGRVAGISGMFGDVLMRRRDGGLFRFYFLGGLVATGGFIRALFPFLFSDATGVSLPLLLVAGLFVGVGTRLGSGCTSGHGVCGLSRLSVRSLVATLTFMGTGFLTVYVTHHLLGGGQR